jgi:hypothetical protein
MTGHSNIKLNLFGQSWYNIQPTVFHVKVHNTYTVHTGTAELQYI